MNFARASRTILGSGRCRVAAQPGDPNPELATSSAPELGAESLSLSRNRLVRSLTGAADRAVDMA